MKLCILKQKKQTVKKLLISGVSVYATLFLLGSGISDVQAGFEWKPPQQPTPVINTNPAPVTPPVSVETPSEAPVEKIISSPLPAPISPEVTTTPLPSTPALLQESDKVEPLNAIQDTPPTPTETSTAPASLLPPPADTTTVSPTPVLDSAIIDLPDFTPPAPAPVVSQPVVEPIEDKPILHHHSPTVQSAPPSPIRGDHILKGSRTVKRSPAPLLFDQTPPRGAEPSVVITGASSKAPALEIYNDYQDNSVIVLDSPLKVTPQETQQTAYTPLAPAPQQEAPLSLIAPNSPALDNQPLSFPSAASQSREVNTTPIIAQQTVVQGFGDNVPLVIALRQIVPADYEFRFSPEVDVDKPVSWQGGKAWNQVMEQLLNTQNLSYTTQQDFIEIYPGNQAPSLQEKVVPPIPVASVVSHQSTPIPAVTPEIEPTASPTVLQTVQYQAPPKPQNTTGGGQIWYGAKDSTLRNVLTNWASKANVELYWDTEFDFPIRATVVLTGTFEEAVQNLLEGFDQSRPRPLGRLHTNNNQGPAVLVIEANDLVN